MKFHNIILLISSDIVLVITHPIKPKSRTDINR